MKIIKKMSEIGGLLFLAFVVMFIAVGVYATTLSQTAFTTGQSDTVKTQTLNNNRTALLAWSNLITVQNLKQNMTLSEKIGYAFLNLTGKVKPADLDPNFAFITATSTGRVTGFGPLLAHAKSPTPDLTLTVDTGSYTAGGKVVLYAGGTSPALVRPTTFPRIAVLALDANGVFSGGTGVGDPNWLYGDENASPVPPPIPPWLTPIAYVYSRTAATCDQIQDADNTLDCYIYRDARTLITDIGSADSDRGLQSYWVDHFDRSTGTGFNAEWDAPTNCILSTTEPVALCSGATIENTELSIEPTGAHTENWPHGIIRINRGGTWVMRFRLKFPDEPDDNWQMGWSVAGAANPLPTDDYVAVLQGSAANTFICGTDATGPEVSGDLPFTPTNWNLFELRVNSGDFACYLNGRLVYSHSVDADIPSALTIYPRFLGENVGAASAQEWRLAMAATGKVPAVEP